jgi:putative intracellular protease/amidase
MSLKGKIVLFFAGPLYEDLELWYPKIRLEEEGARTVVAGTGERTYQGKRGYPITVDTSVDEISAVKDDLVTAGMLWEDSAVVVDGNLISSRTPADLPRFGKAIIAALEGARVPNRESRPGAKPASRAIP